MNLPLGSVVATPNALNQIPWPDVVIGLNKHHACNWGELKPRDKKANDFALANGERILSAYIASNQKKFWIVTEWDRSVTTILMPEDY